MRSPTIVSLGHSDQGGRPDGVQVIVWRGHAFIGHMDSNGFTVVDISDPRAPQAVAFVPCPPHTRCNHLQVHDGLLLAVNSADKPALRDWQRRDAPPEQRVFTAGLRVFDVTAPAAPRDIGFCPVDGIGLHRIWWVGGRYAYASAHFAGCADHILAVFDLADPARPVLAGRWALPGTPPAERRWALHHMIVAGDRGYGAWRDGGLTVHDLSDPVAPLLLGHRLLAPPFPGGSHTALPLPRRGLVVLADEPASAERGAEPNQVWLVDVRAPENPLPFAAMPQPGDADYWRLPGKFGPHNLHENRPGLWQSETLIFATWNNAGVRVFDIADAWRPREVGHVVPDPRGGVTQSADVCVDRDGHLYVTDGAAGLSIFRFDGA